MFQKIKNLENNFSINKAVAIIGGFTLLTKLVALFRDPLILAKLGVGNTSDIYFSAFRIPDFIFNLLVLGTLSVALIPVITEYLATDRQKAFRLANSVLNLSILAMAIICLGLFVFSLPLTKFLVPGFAREKLAETVMLMRLFLLSPLIFTASNVFGSILTSQKKFFMMSLAPVLYNLGIIFGLFAFYPKFGLIGLGLGVILGALLHMAIQLYEVLRFGFRWKAVIDFSDPGLRQIFKLFLPRIIGMDISQVSLIVATTVGSILAAGSVTIFTVSNNLSAVPLGVFALSVATVSFPILSEYATKGDNQGFLEVLADNIVLALFFMIPLVILMVLLRFEVVAVIRTIFLHNRLNLSDSALMASVFGILSLSLIGQSLSPMFSRSFYAKQNTIIPVSVNFCSIVLDIILAITLGRHYGLLGVAWGFAIACSFDALLMFICLRIKLGAEKISFAKFNDIILSSIGKIVLGAILMCLASALAIDLFGGLGLAAGLKNIFLKGGLAVLTGILVFVFSCHLLKVKQVGQALGFFRRLM